ncbi:hypothetical protein BGX26_001779 [Mortierella sp. AD094]|nr:hypothetical protein BGX26_001779 [Mortierella sp. AD094]
MFATPSQQQQQQQQEQATAQYTLMSGQPQLQQGQGSEDMFFALERLLMGISPFPPTIPTLAKPTCPSLDDQIMAEIQATSSPSIPSIVLNEQSLDLLQQYYQSQDNSVQSFQYNNNCNGSQIDQSDCSSTSRSASPPSSPYSYSSSLVSSPALPLASESYWMAPTVAAQQQQQQQDWDVSLFDQMSLPLTMTCLENYIAPTATDFLSEPLLASQSKSLKQVTSSSPSSPKKVKTHHRRSSSNCSAISAYESTARREHRASSISSVCSSVSATSINNNNVRPVKSYACPTCTKPFPTRTQLKSHMAIHTDLFPFPCMHAGCELHFKRKHDLRRHIDAKHALVKKYLCTGGCGEGFGRRDQMVRHLRRGACGQGQGFQTD